MKTLAITTTSILSLLPLNCLKSQELNPKPNLLLIIADQWRASALGFKGTEPVLTPHVDRFASEAIVFNNAISNMPVSSPARAQLMTGMFPIENKVTFNCLNWSAPYGIELQDDAICWSDILKEKGYSLGYIGKWHLDAPYEPYIDCANNKGDMIWNEWCSYDRRHGFDYWLSYGTYDNHLKPMYWDTQAKRDEFVYVDQWGPEFEADRAIDFIHNQNTVRDAQKPFALVVSMNPPHSPYDYVPNRYKDIYQCLNVDSIAQAWPEVPNAETQMGQRFRSCLSDYYACVSGVDEQIGRILDTLENAGLAENTLVIITSDHGDCIGMHNEITKNNIYEHSLKIPLLMRYPNKITPRKEDTMISLMDLYPTMLSMLGYKNSIGGQVKAIDYSPLILNGEGQYPDSQPFFRYELKNLKDGERGIRTERYTYSITIENGSINKTLLYDRFNDPHQINNIAKSADPQLIKLLQNQLKQWLIKASDPAESVL